MLDFDLWHAATTPTVRKSQPDISTSEIRIEVNRGLHFRYRHVTFAAEHGGNPKAEMRDGITTARVKELETPLLRILNREFPLRAAMKMRDLERRARMLLSVREGNFELFRPARQARLKTADSEALPAQL